MGCRGMKACGAQEIWGHEGCKGMRASKNYIFGPPLLLSAKSLNKFSYNM